MADDVHRARGARHAMSWCRDVLCNETVTDLLRENYIVWAWEMSTPELRATLRSIIRRESRLPLLAARFKPTLPFIAIMASLKSRVPRPHTIEGTWARYGRASPRYALTAGNDVCAALVVAAATPFCGRDAAQVTWMSVRR